MSKRAYLILGDSHFLTQNTSRQDMESHDVWIHLNFMDLENWTPPRDHNFYRVYVNLDSLISPENKDSWTLKAWKGTLNSLIQKLIHDDGERVPQLVGFIKTKSYDSALMAIHLGVRDLISIDELQADYYASEKVLEAEILTFPTFSNLESHYDKSETLPKNAIPFPIEGLEGESSAINFLRTTIRKVAPSDSSVLICGPTGSGKERVAQALHRYSERDKQRFVILDCASINPQLFESELFGHVEGAFTNAHQARKGVFELAHMGTLFIDQIHLLSLEQQAKLLRALQSQSIQPVGASHNIDVDVRLICASQVPLIEWVRNGKFREDLFYRINVIDLELPSLKERRSDIPVLADSLLKKLSKTNKKPVLNLSAECLEKIILYEWPGNIRELKNCLERAATLVWSDQRKTIEISDLGENIRFAVMQKFKTPTLKEAIKRFEKEYIAQTLRRMGGSKEETAEVLGLSLASLYRKIGS